MAILGLVIGLATLPQGQKLLEYAYWLLREKRVVEKFRPSIYDIGYQVWNQKIFINQHGDGEYEIDLTFVNTSNKNIRSIAHLIFGDNPVDFANDTSLWDETEQGKRDVPKVLYNKPNKKVISVLLPEAVPPNEPFSYKWGYSWPRTYHEGDEYHNIFIDHMHYLLNVVIEFHESWDVTSPICYCDNKPDPNRINRQIVKNRCILEWTKIFPQLKKSYRIEWHMRKK